MMASGSATNEIVGGVLWPEDTVEYRIHAKTGKDLTSLEHLALECNHLARELCEGHVWHYAPFHLRPLMSGNEYLLL